MAIQIEVAPPKDRFVAAAIDFVPPFLLFIICAAAGWSGPAAIIALFSSVYFIFRDLLGNGQSPGKRVCSLQVIDTETDRVPAPMGLIFRNLGFGIPGLNAIYAIVEGIRVIQHPQGLRFGDVFAETGVVKVPPADREKLLVPKRDRPSRESKTIADELPPEGAIPPEGDAAAGGVVPAAPKSEPSRGSGSRPRPAPAATAAPATPAPAPKAKAPVSMDLPDESKPAAPAPAPAAAPAPSGVALGVDDPLKALIDQATAKK